METLQLYSTLFAKCSFFHSPIIFARCFVHSFIHSSIRSYARSLVSNIHCILRWKSASSFWQEALKIHFMYKFSHIFYSNTWLSQSLKLIHSMQNNNLYGMKRVMAVSQFDIYAMLKCFQINFHSKCVLEIGGKVHLNAHSLWFGRFARTPNQFSNHNECNRRRNIPDTNTLIVCW